MILDPSDGVEPIVNIDSNIRSKFENYRYEIHGGKTVSEAQQLANDLGGSLPKMVL